MVKKQILFYVLLTSATQSACHFKLNITFNLVNWMFFFSIILKFSTHTDISIRRNIGFYLIFHFYSHINKTKHRFLPNLTNLHNNSTPWSGYGPIYSLHSLSIFIRFPHTINFFSCFIKPIFAMLGKTRIYF